ncbi:MAG: zf-TFIIB domain-containing protein [Candidatus Hydrogenedentes bacterium]|nr:zf-TFIIB domain-containing protein [Candidatus Hydrogenedentota bacterium]
MSTNATLSNSATPIRLAQPICPDCNAELRAKRMGKAALYFCPAGHGAAIDGATLEAHEHRNTQQTGMHEVVQCAPIARAHGKPRKSPWYPGVVMEMRQIEGVTIDYCPVERGVWLDAPEILSIVNAMRHSKHAQTSGTNARKEAVDATLDIGSDIAIHTSDIWGEAAVDVVVNTAKGVGNTTYYIVEAAGNSIEFAGEVASGIIGFIADALP